MANKTNKSINGYDYYRVRKTIGKKADGSPKIKSFYGKSKKEADAKADEFIDNLNKGITIDYKKITIEELTNIWLYDVKLNDNNFKPGSFSKYEGIYRNYIQNSEIAFLKVFYTKSIDIQQYYNKLSENGKTYSQIKNLNKVLKGMFEYALQEGYTFKNPCNSKSISIPGTKKEVFDEVDDDDLDYFTIDELDIIIKECNKRINNNDTDYLPYLILFSLGTGLRQGECLGLQKQYISKSVVSIKKELSKVKKFENRKKSGYEYKLITPKTKASIRNVDLSEHISKIMKDYINNIVKNTYENNNEEFNEKSLIFVTSLCTIIDQSNLLKKWRNFLKDINIEYKKWHALRHGFACMLFLSGSDIKTVQILLGHADVKTTLQIYLHVFPEQKKSAINLLNKKLRG